MKCSKPRKMSVSEFKKWWKTNEAKTASLSGAKRRELYLRTVRVLEGKGSEKDLVKWRSFLPRHLTSYCEDPTNKRRFAIRNWGYRLGKRKNERKTVFVKSYRRN